MIELEENMRIDSGFSRIANHMSSWLKYSQIFGYKPSKEEIINDIRSINLEDALIIIAKFSVLNDQSKKQLKTLINASIQDREEIYSVEPFDLISLLYSIKWFLAYGLPKNESTFNNGYPDYYNIFITVLKISDYLEDNIDNEDEVQNLVLKSWLFTRPGDIDRALVRQYVMFEEIAKNKDFKNELKDSYLDIHSIFEQYYGYSIKDYISVLFALHMPSIKELNLREAFSTNNWGIDLTTFFKKVKIKNVAEQISNDLTVDINTLKTWARNTIDNPFDYEILLSKPLFKKGNWLIPFSPGILNSTIFDGLCFKINQSCAKSKIDFFSFFGRLFEQYISTLLSSAVNSAKKITNYEFIDEFLYGKENKRSPDSHVLLGRTLLIFECKGGRIRKETKISAEPEFSKKDFEKYAIEPIKQANKAYTNILSKKPSIFKNVNKVIILSVSLQSFPKIPKFNDLIADLKGNLHPHIKEIDYIGLYDLELLAYLISHHDITVYKFIKNKKVLDDFIPYRNYYYDKYGGIKRPDLLNEKYMECTNIIRTTLF